jgi:peptidyl-prolyl cis-trans isomerase B (cyclophilin B)
VLRIKLDPAAGGPIPNSIAFLVEQGFYDGLTFHRVVPDFVLQGGDPDGTGSGGPGYSVVGPVPSDYGAYKIGDVAMAKTSAEAPGTAGSQFFVISGQQGTTLPPEYGILGHAYDEASLATIEAIDALAVSDGPPSEEVTITKATLEES